MTMPAILGSSSGFVSGATLSGFDGGVVTGGTVTAPSGTGAPSNAATSTVLSNEVFGFMAKTGFPAA
jgi:hypothetical protein